MTEQEAPVVRTAILNADFAEPATVNRVEIKEVRLNANQRSGRHLHPCPVLGVIVAGSVVFQIEGADASLLRPGTAFYEPANAPVLHFDAQEDGATFIAHYLLGPGARDLIKMLPPANGITVDHG